MKFSEFLAEANAKKRYTDYEEWEELYPQDIGSTFDAWMRNDSKAVMWIEYIVGADFRAKTFDYENEPEDVVNRKRDKWVSNWEAKGWSLYDEEDSSRVVDVILIKPGAPDEAHKNQIIKGLLTTIKDHGSFDFAAIKKKIGELKEKFKWTELDTMEKSLK